MTPNVLQPNTSMKYLSLIFLSLFTTVLPAQRVPKEVTTTTEITDVFQTTSFRISWKSAFNVDSTVLAVFLSSDTVPIIFRKAKSPDTVTFALPDDTTTYRFYLYSVRRGAVSVPANENFRFDAEQYFRLVKLHIWPEQITLRVGEEIQLCAFFELNDGSILMRTQDNNKPTCVARYNDYPQNIKRGRGARQRVVNKTCIEWSVANENPNSYYSPVRQENEYNHTAVLNTQEPCDTTASTIQPTSRELLAAGWETFEGERILAVVRQNGTLFTLVKHHAIFTLASLR